MQDTQLVKVGVSNPNKQDIISSEIGKIHSIETLGALDGEGLRTVIFFSGCCLSCGYCHNPDTWGEGRVQTDYTVLQLVDFCKRYKNYYGNTGGVTLSGGEPLLQPQFALRLIKELHSHGIHVAIDTSGAVCAKEVLAAADLIILDIKHTSPKQYHQLTGGNLSDTLKTLGYIKSIGKRFWVRQVIIPAINDTESQVLQLKSLATGAEKIELLAFHQMANNKWQALNRAYPCENTPECDKKLILHLQKILQLAKFNSQ